MTDTPAAALKLVEIAKRLTVHLDRIEAANPPQKGKPTLYWHTSAWVSGSRVGIRYVSYQSEHFLTKTDAIRYLAWLDAGDNGRHWDALRDAPARRIGEDGDAFP